MTVEVRDIHYNDVPKRYDNVAKIEDYQSKALKIVLMLNDGTTVEVPIQEDDRIVFIMKKYI